MAATRTVPFFNYARAFGDREDEYAAVFRDVVRRGAFIMQSDLARFEMHLAAYLGVKHAVGLGNCTDAIHMALVLAGIKPGDEVIVPSHTMVATVAPIVQIGAVPVLADCGDDHLVDPESVRQNITAKTRAILPVQLNGRTANMDAILQLAKETDLKVVEDSAQGLGSKFRGRYAGTFGAIGTFSFYPAKILGCMGDGGALVTDDNEMAAKARLMRDHGRTEDGDTVLWGSNSRLDNLHAAILDLQFKDFDQILAKRRHFAGLYQQRLGDLPELALPPAPDADPDHFDTYQNYEIEAERRDDLKAFLKERGIGTLIQWGGKAVHQFKELGLHAHLPRTERLFERCLMLPLNLTLNDEDVHYICNAVRVFYGK